MAIKVPQNRFSKGVELSKDDLIHLQHCYDYLNDGRFNYDDSAVPSTHRENMELAVMKLGYIIHKAKKVFEE